MADPLLTSLCTICRIQEPKYKCPRCGTRTCSLPCIKKHKNWSSCNGERDPTVYVAPSKLRTAAGIDHDYNFLTKIERSVELSEKVFRDERDILPEEKPDLHPNKKARLHKGKSRGRVTLDDNSRRWDRSTLQRLQHLGIHVSSMPYGMTRSRENKTSWNKRTRSINWQVEWLVLDTPVPADDSEILQPTTTRILHKVLDQTPLYAGFAASRDHHHYWQLSDEQRAQEKDAKRKKNLDEEKGNETPDWDIGQSSKTGTWSASAYALQDPLIGRWSRSSSDTIEITSADRVLQTCRFFFLKPNTPSREPQRLIPVDPAASLSACLPGLEILEFPTLVVLPQGGSIPEGYVLEAQRQTKPSSKDSKKRKASSALVGYDSSDGSDDAISDDEVASIADTTSSSGSDCETEDEE